ncbi:MAG TPA: type II toxin-antitoxin system RelE/ParE family toxin [Tepidisphaeraceae bacterium]|nr:type II toxin-antitoxin system RelE/ParE family toxin [Tepidisphaeraceae bacterium]
MTHRQIVRPEAEADIADAARWYDDQRPGLGNEFLAAVGVAVKAAAANPFLSQRLRASPEVRRALVKRFPYRVFFIRRPDAVVVIRVLHTARHDRAWDPALRDDEPTPDSRDA